MLKLHLFSCPNSSLSVPHPCRHDMGVGVQNLIERCLQLYMNQKEVVTTLLQQAKIEPGFTELAPQICQVTEHAGPNVKLDNMHQTINGNLPHVYTNGASSVQSFAQATMDFSAHARSIDVSPNMLLPQSANLEMMQGPNGRIESTAYLGKCGGDGILLQDCPGTGNPSISHFSSVESSVQPLNENRSPWDADNTSFGFLGRIPRNFSLSDLTADFTDSSEILEGYSGSAFLAPNSNNFLDPQRRGEHQGLADVGGLDAVSEGLSYEDFSSD
ncbi:unnamed protein product [Withania somnifera]